MTVQSKTMSVQIREGRLRTTPSFLGKIIGSVRYGDRVAVLEEKSSWLLVSPPNADRGWIHQSALTVKKIVLRPGEEDVRKAATTDEIALAGKGFDRLKMSFEADTPA